MDTEFLRQMLLRPGFALAELVLIMLCGTVWTIKPVWGIWVIPFAVLPLVLRILHGGFQFKPVDWLVVVFVATAWVGYWAAYDQVTAWSKIWLIMTAALFYFSLKWQPEPNLFHVSIFLFCVGVGVSLYFFLTHDFVALPRKLEFVNQIGRWIMSIRPPIAWMPIHPNYVAGMIAITTPFVIYPLSDYRKRESKIPSLFLLAVIIGLGFDGLALLMATSRGVFFAIASGVGAWLLWRLVQWKGVRFQIKKEMVFPFLLLIYVCVVVIFLYAGPARLGSSFSGDNYYGNGSRAELFERSLYLLVDHPFTGGGLGSFPGLYSHYILGIPYFYLPNSHNLFLDVGIEQGLIGGFSFLILYLASLWKVSSTVARVNKGDKFKWIVLFSLIVAFVHGMVDDYLYNGVGTILSLFFVSLSMSTTNDDYLTRKRRFDFRMASVITVILAFIALINLNQLRAIWYANMGAIQLAKVELEGFPNSGWIGEEIIPKLDTADASLRSALQFDSTNRTANHRLGLIALLRGDFDSACGFLESAYKQTPEHRGIIKSLGYCYVWLGDTDRALGLLTEIPESRNEMDTYTWWWGVHGRDDLSVNAYQMVSRLDAAVVQP